MNPWQRGKKAPERSPLAKAAGRRPPARPRRSGSSQLVVAVGNNKRGRREPPAFFFHTTEAAKLHRVDRASPIRQAARGALPAVSRSGAGPHMYAQNAGVGSSRFPFEMTMPTGSTLILSSLCPSFFAAIDLPSLIDPATCVERWAAKQRMCHAWPMASTRGQAMTCIKKGLPQREPIDAK